MFSKPKNRYQAFSIHLIISAIIFIILAALIIFIWYPDFLFWTDGGWQGIQLIAGVDFIIGPTLTLIVYKLGKPSLTFDLTVIAIIQIACLTIGTWLVYQERPLALIHANGQFYTMSEKSFKFHDYDSKDALKHDNKVPAWIFVELPEDATERSKLLIDQLRDGPVHSRIDLYRPYQENIKKVLSAGLDPNTLDENIKINLTEGSKVYRFNARYSNSYIELDSKTGEFIAIHQEPESKVLENN